jgi:hypothetical protein
MPLVTVAIIVALITGVVQSANDPESPNVIERPLPFIARIAIDTEGYGSGWVLADNLVITATHLLIFERALINIEYNGERYPIKKVHTFMGDSNNKKNLNLYDLSIVEVHGLKKDVADPLILCAFPRGQLNPPRGAAVIAYGQFHDGADYFIGTIASTPRYFSGSHGHRVINTAAIIPGMSGGPVTLLRRRCVIGVNIEYGYGVSFFTPLYLPETRAFINEILTNNAK